jgi:hypothetical protein
LVLSNDNESASAQVNSLELIQDPNQSSEEPKASSAQEGKPRCIKFLLFSIYAIYVVLLFIVHFKF